MLDCIQNGSSYYIQRHSDGGLIFTVEFPREGRVIRTIGADWRATKEAMEKWLRYKRLHETYTI